MKVYALLILLCIVAILQGCSSAIVVCTAVMAAKTANDPRTIGTQIDDSTLEIRISNALAKDQQLKKVTRIINIAYQGKVLLIGQAMTLDLVERAKEIAIDVNGVSEVYNEIRQGKPVSLRRALMDTWITTKIRWKLLTSNIVKSSNIKVATENGEVFLLGIVANAEGKAAAEIASKINGVKHVTTAFTYLKKL